MRRRRRFWYAIYALYLATLVEAGSWVGVHLLARYKQKVYTPGSEFVLGERARSGLRKLIDGRTELFDLEPDLGWALKAGGGSGNYVQTSQGLRGTRVYPPRPKEGMVRMATFGDSFTYGTEVAARDTWQARLETVHPHLEVLNFGVNAYGPDQAYLYYDKAGKSFEPDVVVMGFMSEYLFRCVNVFRPFYNENEHFPFAKPRFVLGRGGLELLPNPLPDTADYEQLLSDPTPVLRRLGARDGVYHRKYHRRPLDFLRTVRLIELLGQEGPYVRGVYNTESEYFRVSLAILERFRDDVETQGATLVILFYPIKFDLARAVRGQPIPYQPLVDALRERGIRTLDLTDAFRGAGLALEMDRYFMPLQHYSPAGHRRVAGYLSEELTHLLAVRSD